MKINIHSTMGNDMLINNNLVSHRGPNDSIFILDFTNPYITIANLFKEHEPQMIEAIAKVIIENMVIEYTINNDLEGGMFVENMLETMIFDLGEHLQLTSICVDELVYIINENYELLDVIYGDVYGKLSFATRLAKTILPYHWTGNGNLDIETTMAKLAMITNPDLILTT